MPKRNIFDKNFTIKNTMEKKNIVVVTSIIENEYWEILLSKRCDPKFPDAHGKWDLPWGKNEFWENLEDTIVREIKEETWLDIDVYEMIPTHVFNLWETDEVHQHTLVFCYKSKKKWWELTTSDAKIQELKRIKKEDVHMYDLLIGVEKILSFL